MTTVKSTDINYNNGLPAFDFSNGKSEVDEIKEAIEKAEAAMSAPSADKPLVPTKKAAKLPSTKKGKAGRIVGISKDENTLLQSLLQAIKSDRQNGMDSYDEIVNKNQDAFNKLLDRYNK